jgi:hypothetical protein
VEEKAKQETSMQATNTDLLEMNHHKAGNRTLLATCFIQVSCLAYS